MAVVCHLEEVVACIGIEYVVIMHIESVGHVPHHGYGSVKRGESLEIGRRHRWLGIMDTQKSGHGISNIFGSIDSRHNNQTGGNFGHIDTHGGVGGCNILVGQKTPLLEGVALVVIHRDITHEVVLYGVFAEMDSSIYLIPKVFAGAVDFYQCDFGTARRLHVREMNFYGGAHGREVAESIVSLNGIFKIAGKAMRMFKDNVLVIEPGGDRRRIRSFVHLLPFGRTYRTGVYLKSTVDSVIPGECHAAMSGN